jgi:GAF domain-containing protein
LVARTFVELADNLVEDFDIVDVLTLLADRCVLILDAAAAGLMLANAQGELRVMASSSDTVRLVELFELQAEEGPCLDCFRSGEPVGEADLALASARWPTLAPRAAEAGFRAVNALPMRLRGATVGSLNLFRTSRGVIDDDDLALGQAFADVATIAILQHRAAEEAQEVNRQLAGALSSRVVIEQAKGIVAASLGLEMDEAFVRLRDHARRHNLRLAVVAHAVRDTQLAPAQLS